MEKSKVDKLKYVVMLSRWQEAAVNKKYAMKFNECNLLKTQLFEKDGEIAQLEKSQQKLQVDVGKMVSENQSLRKEVNQAKNMFLPLSKAEAFQHSLDVLSNDRDELETKYFKIRAEYTSALSMKQHL